MNYCYCNTNMSTSHSPGQNYNHNVSLRPMKRRVTQFNQEVYDAIGVNQWSTNSTEATLYPGIPERTSDTITASKGEGLKVRYENDGPTSVIVSVYDHHQRVIATENVVSGARGELPLLEVPHLGLYSVKIRCSSGNQCDAFVQMVKLPKKKFYQSSETSLQVGEKAKYSSPLFVNTHYPLPIIVNNTGNEELIWRVFRTNGSRYEIVEQGSVGPNQYFCKDIVFTSGPAEHVVALWCPSRNCSGVAKIGYSKTGCTLSQYTE